MLRRITTGVAVAAAVTSLGLAGCESHHASERRAQQVDAKVFYDGSVTAEHVKRAGHDQIVYTFKVSGGYSVHLDKGGAPTPKDFQFSPSPRQHVRSVPVQETLFPVKVTITRDGRPSQTQTLN